jgi:hypothetical protein
MDAVQENNNEIACRKGGANPSALEIFFEILFN